MKKVLIMMLAVMLFTLAGCGGSDKAGTASADSPEGVLKGYYDALKNEEYDKAYGFLKTDKTKEEFIVQKKASSMNFTDFEVKDVKATGDKATGNVVFKTGSEQMPEITLNAELVKEGGKWLITSMGMGGGMGGMGGMPPGGMPPANSDSGTMPPSSGSSMPPTSGSTMPPAQQ